MRALWDELLEAGSLEDDAAAAIWAKNAANPEGRREERWTDDGQTLVDRVIETLELAQERLELNNLQGEEAPALARVADALAKLHAGRRPARQEPHPVPRPRG